MGGSGGFERVSDLVPRGEGGDTGDTVINTPALRATSPLQSLSFLRFQERVPYILVE